MKRIISFLVVMAMVLSLGIAASSCGGDDQGSTGKRRGGATASADASGDNQSAVSADTGVSGTDASDNTSSGTGSAANTSSGGAASQGPANTPSNGGNTGNQGDNQVTPGKTPEGMQGLTPEEQKAFQNTGKVTTYSSLAPSKSLGNADKYKSNGFKAKFDKYFADNFGGTVEYINCDWSVWESTYATDFVAGSAPDLIYLFERNWPKAANRGWVYSVEDMEEMGIQGLNNPALNENKKAAQELYTWMGERYTFACQMLEPDMFWVNEEFFEALKVDSPSKLYKEGRWNMKTFLETCQKVYTKKTTAFYTWDMNMIVANNGGQLVEINKNAKNVRDAMKVGFETTATKNGLQYIYDLVNTYHGWYAGKDGHDMWKANRVGMFAWMPRNESEVDTGQSIKEYGRKWSVVPFPLGADNSAGYHSAKCYSYAVSKSANSQKRVQGAVNFIIAYETFTDSMGNVDPQERDYKRLETYFTADQVKMFRDCSKKVLVPFYTGIGTLNNTQWALWGNLADGFTVEQIVGTYSSSFQQQVNGELEQAA